VSTSTLWSMVKIGWIRHHNPPDLVEVVEDDRRRPQKDPRPFHVQLQATSRALPGRVQASRSSVVPECEQCDQMAWGIDDCCNSAPEI
jgi:hypothetical protein